MSSYTGSEWHCTFVGWQSHYIFSCDQQLVSDIEHLWKAVSLHPFLWPTASEQHCTFWERQAHCIWPTASEWHCTFCENCLIVSFQMTNRKWVTQHILWKGVSLHLFLWPTASEWRYTFVKGSLIVALSALMSNRKLVTFHILWKTVSLHLSLWPTGSEWHYTFCDHLFLWPTESEWHCTFCEMQSHWIIYYDSQRVSGIVHFVRGSLIASFPMSIRKWVTFHILWNAGSLHLFLWPTASKSHCTVCERKSHCIASFPMTNRKWVILHMLWKGVPWCLFLWPTGSEWHWTFCER